MKYAVGLVCLSAVLVFMSGCGPSGKKEKVLTVCTENEFADIAENLADYYRLQNPEVKFKMGTLSVDEERREAEIKKLRTEIMTGAGPDVFVLSTDGPSNAEVPLEPLFENAVKVMKAGVLLNLDEYMEADEVFHREDYVEAVLEAGTFEECQYVLPISYTMDLIYLDSGVEGIDQWILPGLDVLTEETLRETVPLMERPFLKNAGTAQLQTMWQSQIPTLIDYENERLRMEEDEISRMIAEGAQFTKESLQNVTDMDSADFMELYDKVRYGNRYFQFPRLEEQYRSGRFAACENEDGKVYGSVQYFAAVGRGCKLKQEAYEYIRLYLLPEFQTGGQVGVGEHYYGNIRPLHQELPVCRSVREGWLREICGGYIRNEDLPLEELWSVLDEVDTVSIRSDVNRRLEEVWQQVRRDNETSDKDKLIQELVDFMDLTAKE